MAPKYLELLNLGVDAMDLADEGCTFETICGGTGNVVKNALDKSAPKITWFQVDTFPGLSSR